MAVEGAGRKRWLSDEYSNIRSKIIIVAIAVS